MRKGRFIPAKPLNLNWLLFKLFLSLQNQLGILKIINGVYFIAAEEGLLKTLAKKYPVKEPRVDASKLHWTAFVAEVKRDKFSIHSKKASKAGHETRGVGGF